MFLRERLEKSSLQYHLKDIVQEYPVLVKGEIQHALYYARYFGHKLHLDQNEKLVHYGVIYVLARDGFSGKKIAGTNTTKSTGNHCWSMEYGLWDQIRVDHSKESYLTL